MAATALLKWHWISVLQLDYNEPPGKVFPDGFLELIIVFSLVWVSWANPIQPVSYYRKIRTGKRLIRLKKLPIDGADPFKSMFEHFAMRLLQRNVI